MSLENKLKNIILVLGTSFGLACETSPLMTKVDAGFNNSESDGGSNCRNPNCEDDEDRNPNHHSPFVEGLVIPFTGEIFTKRKVRPGIDIPYSIKASDSDNDKIYFNYIVKDNLGNLLYESTWIQSNFMTYIARQPVGETFTLEAFSKDERGLLGNSVKATMTLVENMAPLLKVDPTQDDVRVPYLGKSDDGIFDIYEVDPSKLLCFNLSGHDEDGSVSEYRIYPDETSAAHFKDTEPGPFCYSVPCPQWTFPCPEKDVAGYAAVFDNENLRTKYRFITRIVNKP